MTRLEAFLRRKLPHKEIGWTPIEEDSPCVSRRQIGRQVGFLINKLRRIRDHKDTPESIRAIVKEVPAWIDPVEYV